jgi:hypothetical protein
MPACRVVDVDRDVVPADVDRAFPRGMRPLIPVARMVSAGTTIACVTTARNPVTASPMAATTTAIRIRPLCRFAQAPARTSTNTAAWQCRRPPSDAAVEVQPHGGRSRAARSRVGGHAARVVRPVVTAVVEKLPSRSATIPSSRPRARNSHRGVDIQPIGCMFVP